MKSTTVQPGISEPLSGARPELRDVRLGMIAHPASVTPDLTVSADALIAGGEFVTESILKRLPRLRVIARSGVGYDRIEVPAATARNILVTITPTAVHEAAAEHALALLFAISKNVKI